MDDPIDGALFIQFSGDGLHLNRMNKDSTEGKRLSNRFLEMIGEIKVYSGRFGSRFGSFDDMNIE